MESHLPDLFYDFIGDYKYHVQRHKGNWNGYVILPPSHPDIGKHYDDIKVEVHGGLTYGKGNTYGFDTFHSDDWTEWSQNETYRDFEYVKSETLSLLRQFAQRQIEEDAQILFTLLDPFFDSITQPIAQKLLGDHFQEDRWKEDILRFQAEPGTLQHLVVEKLIND